MTTWRDSASEQAQADLDELVNAALGTAEHELSAHGEFYPFAVVRTVDGDSQLLGVAGDDENPTSQDLIGRLWDALVEQRDGCRAVGVVSDRTTEDGDRVAVQLEHAEGLAIEVTLAYRLDGQRFEPGALAAGGGTLRVW